MQSQDNKTIRITLDVSVPVGAGDAVVKGPCQPTVGPGKRYPEAYRSISHPDENGTTLAKQVNGRWYICAYGTVGGDVRHVFARVYDDTVSSFSTSPPQHQDTMWASTVTSTSWKFPMLPLPEGAVLPDDFQLVLWTETGSSGYDTDDPHPFTAEDSGTGYTYCETYGVAVQLRKQKKKDWTRMAERWSFEIEGCSNAGCGYCDCLNGEWVLTRDQKGGKWIWHVRLKTSIRDRTKPAWWRLAFNRDDGFWYLEYVEALDQPPGLSISYRRHEGVWDPTGPNVMFLHCDQGLCNVPERVTLVPA
jgi:hypothetical protein